MDDADTLRPLILVVDDHADLRRIMTEVFESEGYQVLTAAGGPEAIAACLAHRPRLVLLDIHMPGMDGFSVLETLRTRGIPARVAMMTAIADEACRRRALGLGACDYFVKGGFELDHLLDRVAIHVAAA